MQTSSLWIRTFRPSDGRTARFEEGTDRPRRHRHSRGGHGFTLIELLVVVGMIATLAGVLFSVFAQARARAQQTTCASRLAQIAHAGLLYLQDYDERFSSCYALGTAPYVVDPRTSLQPYTKNWELFYCPDRHTVLPHCLDPAADFRTNSRRVPAQRMGLRLQLELRPGLGLPQSEGGRIGTAGDGWKLRGRRRVAGGGGDPFAHLLLERVMNFRDPVQAISGTETRKPVSAW